MSQNLKIRRSQKAWVSPYSKSGWKYCRKYVAKDMLFSNYHVKFIFPMALAVEDSALGLILFCFHSLSCFMIPEKILVFKQIILFRKKKFGGEIERICRTSFRGFLDPVNRPKNSILNWVSNLNAENKNFFHYSKTHLSYFCLQSLEKIRFNLHRVGCLISQISPLFFRY